MTLVHMALLISSQASQCDLVNKQILKHLSHLTKLVNMWTVSWCKKKKIVNH